MDGATGTVRPSDPSAYTMRLNRDGTVTMRLNCNRASGSWFAEPGSDGASGRFEFGTLAATRALCPPPSMDENIAANARFIRSYLLKDGRLYLSLMADGSVATGPDDSALRAGQGNFDATGTIPCAQYAGQPMNECKFGVARAGGGYATVVITKPDGRTRAIYFRMGKAVGADTSEADNPGKFGTTREADLNFIRIGNERYEIPDAVVLGG